VTKTPHVLVICDGFGVRREIEDNAVRLARTPALDRIRLRYPSTEILSHGEAVGLMPGLMGNSEVGHMNIGGGRIVVQAIDRINKAVADRSFFQLPPVLAVLDRARTQRLHLLGLLSDGGVHSHEDHLVAILEAAAASGLRGDRVLIHAFTDGRDTPPSSALEYLRRLEAAIARHGVGAVATVSGRYYAMDRDHRWERVARAYDALVHGRGLAAPSAAAAIGQAYARGETDEFIQPTVVGGLPRIAPRDAVFFFNFRADRARELSMALTGAGRFDAFPTVPLDLLYATMTEYRADFPFPRAFGTIALDEVFGEMLEKLGMTQLRIAETEKYAHVTFFLNGGREEPFGGEERILVPSPKVATYDLVPEMSAATVTDRVIDAVSQTRHDAIVVNFANPDMVGHTGRLDAAIKAVECVDACIGRIMDAVVARGGSMIVTADHGNCEQMRDFVTGEPHTAHTTNPVPLHLVSERHRSVVLQTGRLCDVVPTLLATMGVEKSRFMTGVNLMTPGA
jgi:2,3-bisphosphoglycerate-independent phosphoglycerate mutase